MKTRVYSIRIKESTLLGLIDLLELYGISTSSSASSIITTFLDNIVESKRLQGELPTYSFNEISLLLAEKLNNAGKVIPPRTSIDLVGSTSISRRTTKEQVANLSALTNEDFQPSLNSNFKSNLTDTNQVVDDSELLSEIEEMMNESRDVIEEEARQFLRDSLTLKQLPQEYDIIQSVVLPSQLPSIEVDDPRLEKDKLYNSQPDELRPLLRVVYYNLPHDSWSSETAEKLLLQLAKNFFQAE